MSLDYKKIKNYNLGAYQFFIFRVNSFIYSEFIKYERCGIIIMNYEDLKEKRIREFAKRFEESNLIEDLKFREIAKSKEAVEEILQTILNDDKLKVVKTIEQKNLSEAIYHGVILDCECILSTNEIVNIEVQVALNDNPVYRMRYNQSALTISHSPKSKSFKYNDISRIISVMICDFDLFKLDEPIYEVVRNIKNTSLIAENGVKEIYINLKSSKAKDKLKLLFKVLTDVSFIDENNFPNLSNKKPKYKKGGVKMLNGLTKEFYEVAKNDGINQGIEQGLDEGKKILLIDLLNQNIITEDIVMEKLNITKEELEVLIKKYK